MRSSRTVAETASLGGWKRARWGAVSSSLLWSHRTSAVVQITVYPPGTNDAERRTAHLSRALSGPEAIIVTGALVVVSLIAFQRDGVPLAAAAILVHLATLAIVRRLDRKIREQSRSHSMRVWGNGRIDGLERFSEIATALDRLDRRHDLSPVDYELEWASIYNRMQQPAVR